MHMLRRAAAAVLVKSATFSGLCTAVFPKPHTIMPFITRIGSCIAGTASDFSWPI